MPSMDVLEMNTDWHHLTPVDLIPSEILADILEMAAEDAQLQPGNPPVKPPFQLVVGQVCRRWRSLVLNLPLLWNQIYIGRRSHPKFIRLRLQRSKDIPIDIFMTLYEKIDWRIQWSTKYEILHFMRQITPHSRRWRRLVIDVHDGPALCRVLRYLKDTFTPRLEHIDLRTKRVSNLHLRLCLPDKFLHQNAHSFSWFRFHNLRPPFPPMCRLTHLDLSHVPFSYRKTEEFRTYMSMSPLLMHLRINDVLFPDYAELTKSVISIPSLLSLTLQNMLAEVVLELLSTFCVKSLSVLRLIGDPMCRVVLNSPNHFQVFRDVSTNQPRFPKLYSLTLHHAVFPPTMAVEFFRGMPNVGHLALFGHRSAMVIHNIGWQAHYMPDEGPVWPHLRIFSTAECIDYLELQKILAARLTISCPIPHLKLYDPILDSEVPSILRHGTGVETIDLLPHEWDTGIW